MMATSMNHKRILFNKTLREYGEACEQLSWAGGAPSGIEIRERTEHWTARRNELRKKLQELAGFRTTGKLVT